jgi:alpha-N-arabinofuranosidase
MYDAPEVTDPSAYPTHLADLPLPQVKYWALGNETWGPWQVEQLSAPAYAAKAYQWAKALKRLDPSITLVLCGKEGFTTWDALVTKECVRPERFMPLPAPPAPGERVDVAANVCCLVDMLSIHLYTTPGPAPDALSPHDRHAANVLAPLAAEHAIESAANLVQLARIENAVPPHLPPVRICFDEWNVWDPALAPGEHGAEQEYTLGDALAVGVWLNVFIRQARHVAMANLAQSVNVISPLRTSPDGLVRLPTWWPLVLFSRYMRAGVAVAVHVASPAYDGPTSPPWLRAARNTPWLDASCVRSDDGHVALAVVNAHPDRAFPVRLDPRAMRISGPVRVFEVNGSRGLASTADHVAISERDWSPPPSSAADDGVEFEFAAHSLTLLRWKL